LLRVLVGVPGHVRRAGLEDRHRRTAIGQRQPVQPELLLPVAHRSVAGAERHQAIGHCLVEEHVGLLGANRLANQRRGLVEGWAELGRIDQQQALQGGQQPVVELVWRGEHTRRTPARVRQIPSAGTKDVSE
jgi:hypothetical protein